MTELPMSYTDYVRDPLTGVINIDPTSTEDQLWNKWVFGCKYPDNRERLQSLLTANVRREFKARALFVLLAPDLCGLPFKWVKQSGRYLSIDDCPEDLLPFAGRLVCRNVDFVLGTKNEKLHETLTAYNHIIIQLLGILRKDDALALELYGRYQINDKVAWSGISDNPFHHILNAKNVPLKWKRLADTQMRDRILLEEDEKILPRRKWERALHCYAYRIMMANYDGRKGYSRRLFVSQIEFIIGLPNIETCIGELFRSWHVAGILRGLAGDSNRTIRYRLARLLVLPKKEGDDREPVCPVSVEAARMILAEFGDEDAALSQILRGLIADADRRELARKEAEQKEQQRNESILAQMK